MAKDMLAVPDFQVSREALQSAHDVAKDFQAKIKPGHTFSVRKTKTGIAMMVRFPRQKVPEPPNAIETDTKI
jgi:hypothetical protein